MSFAMKPCMCKKIALCNKPSLILDLSIYIY
jgi:hypothetical protein